MRDDVNKVKPTSLTIIRAANGYMVTPLRESNTYIPQETYYVFNEFADAATHIQDSIG